MSGLRRVTPDEIAVKLAELRQALKEWQILEARWGTVDDLQREIDTYEWLAGGAS